MKIEGLVGLSLATAAAGGLYASDALTRGEVYDLPFEQVHGELAAMPLPDDVTQVSAAGVGRDIEVHPDQAAINWVFLSNGEQTARFTATLSREGERRTRVVVDYVAGPALPDEMFRISDTTLMRKLAAAALAEQVDSRLERRPFERSGFMTRAAEHLQNNPDAVREYGNAVRDMMIDIADQARANAEASTGPAFDPPVGRPSPDATRPTLELSKQ